MLLVLVRWSNLGGVVRRGLWRLRMEEGLGRSPVCRSPVRMIKEMMQVAAAVEYRSLFRSEARRGLS